MGSRERSSPLFEGLGLSGIISSSEESPESGSVSSPYPMAASPASIASISLAADNVDDVDTASNVAMKFLEMALVR